MPSSTAPNSSVPRSRRHNPVVAGYLGLGNETDPIPIESSSQPTDASTCAQPPKLKRQRVTKTQDGNRDVPVKTSKKKAPKRAAKAAKQRLISHGLPVRKTSGLLTPERTPKNSFENGGLPTTTGDGLGHSSEASKGQAVSSASRVDHFTNDLSTTNRLLQSGQRAKSTLPVNNDVDDDDLFDEDLDDEALLILSEGVERSFHTYQNTAQKNTTAASSTPPVTTRTNAARRSSQFKPPVTPLTSLVSKLDMKPIVRPPFPEQVRDRSPVVGLTPNCLLRTCFRVGEAINASRHAMRNGKNVMVELYARVLRSHRDETKQHFVLCDLFHGNPPFLRAEYDASIWRSVPLYEIDSRVLLSEEKSADESKVCRCILTTKNCGNKEWVATMLNIWPAKEEDIKWVEGIVNS